MNSLQIGEYIYNILSNNEELTNLITKITPIVADNDTALPFAVYKRVSLNSNRCKDGTFEDVTMVEIVVVSASYSQGIEIANIIRDCMVFTDRTVGDMFINESTLSQTTEEYSNNAYIQKLQFTITITK